MDELDTLPGVLRRRASEQGVQIAYSFLPEGGDRRIDISYEELDRRACAIATELLARGATGHCVLLLCPSGLDYVAALLGCFYAGAIAVPGYPPTRTSLARALSRIRTIAEDARAGFVLTTAEVAEITAGHLADTLSAVEVIDATRAMRRDNVVRPIVPSAEQPAILQYTSGSTSTPKGILLSHGQLAANLRMTCGASHLAADDVFLVWLPPYHDMGLIGGIFLPLCSGGRGVLMPTEAFVRRPLRWLRGVAQESATVLMSPNFGFELCLRRITREARLGLDLSSVRIVFNGAEPIDPRTLEAFTKAFAPHGLRADAFYPCYGMAEATLTISIGAIERAPVIRSYSAGEFEARRAVEVQAEEAPAITESSTPKTRRLVGCGGPLPGERILIVDPEARRTLGERMVGEIWVQSPSVALGYWQRPKDTEATFRAYTEDTREGPFLRTGDLGFFDRGELFIAGRLKDLIIVRGRNHHPHDIERTVQAVHDGLVTGAGAAFSVEAEGGERLVIVQELDKRVEVDTPEALRDIARAVREEHDLSASAVVLIKRGSLPKTASGKVQRRATREAYLAGELIVSASWEAAAAPSVGAVASEDAAAQTRTHTRPVASSAQQRLVDWLRALLADRIARRPDEIDPHEPLARYGVDSLVATELSEELETLLGVPVPSTISYDNPTIAEIARALAPQATVAGTPTRMRAAPARRPVPEPREAVAIVGMACRFPGANDLDEFWQLLREGRDAVGEVPEERWDAHALYDPEPGAPGKICTRAGGFVDHIDWFDAEFFGISAREAARIDPQQRLFLELSWRALEDAGLSPATLAGSRTGVFAGVCTSDYATLYGGDLRLIDTDYGTGNSASLIPNRLSYFLDLKGPSESIDSACSSALVALQHACQSIGQHDCELAIVGGVNALLAPESSVYFSQLGALSRNGRCRSFDRSADGFVRSEGAGVVVLKPLRAALADGDRIYALIAGSAVNHDGRSNGIVAPNGKAQEDAVRRALAHAGISADDIDYVEAHGVGTKVADAVELNALGRAFAERKHGEPVLVGSAKTNLGHLEAASGMVGLIKLALALHHEAIPPHLHLSEVHPEIGIERLPLAIPTRLEPWKRGTRPRFAGLSAFGFGGTNAHVIVREAPMAACVSSARDAERPAHVLALSARNPAALRELARAFAHRLAALRDGEQLADVCFSANVGRAHFAHRLAVVASEPRELQQTLERVALELPAPQAWRGRAGSLPAGVALVFEGAAAEAGAGRAFYDGHAPFRRTLELCDRLLTPELDGSLLEALYAPDQLSEDLLARPSYQAAASLALAYALFETWHGFGIAPTSVHAGGTLEYAAAAAAGVLAWQQAIVLGTRAGIVREGLTPGASQRLTVHKFRQALSAVAFTEPSVRLGCASRAPDDADGTIDAAHFARLLYAEKSAGTRSVGLDAAEAALVLSATDDWATTLRALATLYVHGQDIDWRGFDAAHARRKVDLPSYPFQRERHWLDFPARTFDQFAPSVIERPSSHPLISRVRIHGAPRSGFFRREGSGGSGAAGS